VAVLEDDGEGRHNVGFLQEHEEDKVIVYFLTCACVDFYALALPVVMAAAGKGTPQTRVVALHGKMKQAQREAKLAAFTSSQSGIGPCPAVAPPHLAPRLFIMPSCAFSGRLPGEPEFHIC
jgi:ATP-dependent RNA helicase DDX55/SPB4